MKAEVELWVRLKVADLVALTAWITLTEKMDFSPALIGVARYSFWRMSAEGSSRKSILDAVGRVVRSDSAFTNQNKHYYRLTVRGSGADGEDVSAGSLQLEKDFPLGRGDSGGDGGLALYACDLLIREQGSEKDKGYALRLNGRLEGARISDVRSGEVWRLMVLADNEDGARAAVEKMAVTRSRKEGLLLNPHYQSCEFLGISEVHRRGKKGS